jgi:trans-aconitate 2-methyltransferase
MNDWQPKQYLKYKNERTQPSIDLVNRISHENPARIIDIGCGPGNSTVILKNRWQDADIYGLDNSKNMIQKAEADFPDIRWLLMNANDDLSSLGQFDIVFTNAALQWMPEHETLIPNMYKMLNDKGVLAAQVPCVKHLPVYAGIQELIKAEKWAEYFISPPIYPKHYPYEHYYDIICGLTDKIEMWQTDYIHIMPDHKSIVEWYKGTGLRPFMDMIPDEKKRLDFCNEYGQIISRKYPIKNIGKNSSVLLPFTRIFFIAYK